VPNTAHVARVAAPSTEPLATCKARPFFGVNASPPAQASRGLPRTDDERPLRLWRALLTGRIALAVLLCAGVWAQGLTAKTPISWDASLLGFYLVCAVVMRWLHGRRVPSPKAGPHWLDLVGIDLITFSALQWLDFSALSYAPLFGLPVMMAALFGSRQVALGTAAGVSLALLAHAGWLASQSTDTTARVVQAGLAGLGWFLLALLLHQIAMRLATETQLARQGHSQALLQQHVNALVIENLRDGVVVAERGGLIRAANPAAVRLLGDEADGLPLDADPVAPDAHMRAGALFDLIESSFAQQLPQSAELVLGQSGDAVRRVQAQTRLTDPAAISSTDRDAEPDEISLQLCVVFIHDLREAQARLRTEKLAAMGRMSAAVAHEIRNPLAAIVQANALLAEDLHRPQDRRLTTLIEHNAQRLARIAEDVLNISRVQQQLPSQSAGQRMSLDAAVARMVSDWTAAHPQRPLWSHLQCPDMEVVFDPEHLRRVVVNLLDNAARYASEQADAIQVRTEHRDTRFAVLSIWSDGAPLERGVEQHLFEPFFSSESRSTGLGLFICRELCERHGASLRYQRRVRSSAEATARDGNDFTVVLRRLNLNPSAETNAPGFDTMTT
jgi:two-component system, NtrC family, sensor histidine kinase PilS